MLLRKWEDLPIELQLDEVRPYYDILKKKQISLLFKRVFDIVVSLIMLIVLLPLFVILAIAIKLDSEGPVFYRQERITQYGKVFRIHKFRSMCNGADKKGTLVTVNEDSRITKVGKFIRKYKIDEISQLIDVLQGNMSFVGTRPEVKKYVDNYTNEFKSTLLLPAGVTSSASIQFKDENDILEKANNIDEVYIKEIVPQKMKYNLDDIKQYSFIRELGICIRTVLAVIR